MRRRAVWLGIIAVLYMGLSLLYNVTVPLWETPDEPGHVDYAVYLLQHRSLPRMEAGRTGEAHQPPLYYLLIALTISPVDLTDPTGTFHPNPNFVHRGQGGYEVNISLHEEAESTFPYRGWSLAVHLARLVSSLLGLGTVLFTYAIARKIFSNTALPLLAAALVAFNPQFLFISAAVNNDNMLAFSASGLLWYALTLLERMEQQRPLSPARWLGLGGWVLIILLTKLTGLAVVGATVLVLFIAGWRRRRLPEILRGLALAGLVAALGSSWWWWRNQVLYGDLLGWQVYQEVFAVNVRNTPLTLPEIGDFLRTQLRSFWGVFGWMTVYAPQWYYSLTRWSIALAALGWAFILLLRKPFPLRQRTVRYGLFLLTLATLMQEAYLFAIVQRADASMWQGRYLFPALAPASILLAGGIAGWVPKGKTGWVVGAVLVLLVGLALYMPLKVIRPAYAPPIDEEIVISHPLEVTFGDQFLLRGYDLEQDSLSVTVTLYWKALRRPDFDYSVFVHLVDGEGNLVGQQDHAPGSDRNHPPLTWRPGEEIADPHRIPLIAAPQGALEMRIGVYNWATGERLPAYVDGEPMGDMVTIQAGSARTPWPLILGGGGLLVVVIGTWVLWRRHRRQRGEECAAP